MKILKATILALVLIGSQLSSKASGDEKGSVNKAVTSFVDAYVHGKLKGFSEVLDENVVFTTRRGDKVITNKKSEIMDALKTSENIEQNCELATTTVEDIPGQVIVKVAMKYAGFTKENYVTLIETEKGWKISRVTSTYE